MGSIDGGLEELTRAILEVKVGKVREINSKCTYFKMA